MTSKLVVNTIEADTGISSVSFASSISMDSTSKFHFSAAGVDIGADTNINRPAAGKLAFNINSSEKVRITSDGFLGISTASVLAPLHAFNATNNTIARLESGDATCRLQLVDSAGMGFVAVSGDNLIFANTSSITERARLDASGSLLIGGTSSSGATEKLRIENDSATSDVCQVTIISGNADRGILNFGDAQDHNIGRVTYDHSANALFFHTDNTERLRIDSSGRVIITNDGVTNPTGTNTQYAPLVVRGNTSATSSRSGWLTLARSEASANISANEGIGEIFFGDQQAGEYGAIKCFADAAAAVGDYPGRLSFWTTADGANSPTERLRIAANGIITHTGKSGAAANPAIDPLTSFVLNDAEARLQLCATNGGNNAAAIILSNESKHFIIHQRGPSQSNNFEIGYGDEASPTDINNQATTYFRINTSGHVLKPKNPRFSFARQAGWTTIAGQNTIIVWNQTLSADPSSSYNSGNGRFTAPVAGSYCFLLLMYTRRDDGSQGDQGYYMNTYIRKNGSSPAYSNNIQHYYNAGDQDTTSNCHMMLDLAQNDYVDVIMNASGTNFRYYGYHCTFSGWLVG